MTLVRRDNNELRYNSIFLLEKKGNPDYYKELIRNTKAFFYGMRREDLLKEMNVLIKRKIEEKVGSKINYVLMVYANLTYYNSFTKQKYTGEYIFKHQLMTWFDELEEWIFRQVTLLEQDIRFVTPPKQWV